MTKKLPIMLWLAVIVAGTWTTVRYIQGPAVKVKANGVNLVEVPWKYFSDVERFELTNQAGELFDSNRLNGKVYAVSFFFASCPSICRELNGQISVLNQQLAKDEINFVSISVDPEVDTPEVLRKYAADFNAQPGRWEMLTGPMHRIKHLGEQVFQVVVDKATHTESILLVDKWGRYRDCFKWNDPEEMKRFVQVSRGLIAEPSPPLETIAKTRNALPLSAGQNWETRPWIRDFRLTEKSGKAFYSRDLTGQVWIGSFFFASCPGICPKQNEYLAALYERTKEKEIKFVSITTDPGNDTVSVLKSYASQYKVPANDWLFCTGPEKLIRRISAEFFSAAAGKDHHSSLFFVVDRWGRLRGRFNWQKPEHETAMLTLVDNLNRETSPVPFDNVLDPDAIQSPPQQEAEGIEVQSKK